jgi:hypothetical protein
LNWEHNLKLLGHSAISLMIGSRVQRARVDSVLPGASILRLSRKSLPRGIILSLGAFLLGLRLAGFPYIQNLHGSHWEFLALALAAWGMGETARCLQRRWSFYHAGVILLLYSDLMILTAIVVLLAIS